MPIKSEATVHFDENDIQELDVLTKHAGKISALVSEGAKIRPMIGTVPFSKALSKKIGLDPRAVLTMVHGLVSAFRVRDELSATGDELSETIVRSLKKAGKTDLVQAWKPVKVEFIEAINALTEDHPLMLSFNVGSKAHSLPNYALSMELSTGTQPVFSDGKDRILFTIIHHTLALEYHEGYRLHKEISLSLDAGDIVMLRALCDEAEKGAAALKATISGPSAVLGEFDDDEDDATE